MDGLFSKAVIFQTLEFFLAWIIGLCIQFYQFLRNEKKTIKITKWENKAD